MGTIAGRKNALVKKHAMLDQQILDELGRPLPDSLKMQDLKSQKVHVKTELAALAQQPSIAVEKPIMIQQQQQRGIQERG